MDFSVGVDVDAWVGCPECNQILPVPTQLFEAYFLTGRAPCPRCEVALDWWSVVRASTRQAFPSSALMLAGAETRMFRTTLGVDERKEIAFSDYGIPEEAEIIRVNLTSNGSALPHIHLGNEPFREPFPNRIFVRGQKAGDLPGDGPLVVSVTWFARGPTDSSIRHLVEAARHYEAMRFDAVVLPANIAVEAKLGPVVHDALTGFCGRDRLRSFLNDAATYSHQLNIVVPMIAALVQAPRLPEEIAGILNRLRGLRNDVVHKGSCNQQSQDDAADYITAALFGIQYSALLQKLVDEARRSGKLPYPARAGTSP